VTLHWFQPLAFPSDVRASCPDCQAQRRILNGLGEPEHTWDCVGSRFLALAMLRLVSALGLDDGTRFADWSHAKELADQGTQRLFHALPLPDTPTSWPQLLLALPAVGAQRAVRGIDRRVYVPGVPR